VKNSGCASWRFVAFTLLELLIVLVIIGIIALLISILIPTLNSARERANRVRCLSNLRQIGQAEPVYALDNQGHLSADHSYMARQLTQSTTLRFHSPSGELQSAHRLL